MTAITLKRYMETALKRAYDNRYVYVLQSIEKPNVFKIGVSMNPEKRKDGINYEDNYRRFIGRKGLKLFEKAKTGSHDALFVEQHLINYLQNMADEYDIKDLWNELFEINDEYIVNEIRDYFAYLRTL
jgi:hypothetical protein